MKIENRKTFYLAIIMLFLEMLYGLSMILTNSHWICTYFSIDPTNTAMDYFNMLAKMQDATPPANYPAMCFIFWKIMYCLIPKSLGNVDGFFLRNDLTAQLGYIIFMVLTTILIYELFRSFEIGGKIERILLSISLILSGPMLFTYERGNIIILSFLFLLLFIRLFNSENKYLRFIAYTSLAISASIKIYPALFGILIIEKKRYKDALIAIVLGILLFILPFFAFEGIHTIKEMIEGIGRAASIQASSGVGFNFSFSNLIKILGKFCGMEIEKVSSVFIILSIIYCLVIFLLTSKNWQKIFMVSLLCIWIPSYSYTYVLIILIIPFLYYLKEEKDDNSFASYLYGALFVIILIPIALPNIESSDSFRFPMSFPTVIINFAILLISLSILLEQLIKKKKNKRKEKCKDGETMKRDKLKVGLLTVYYSNYGSFYQALALKRKIEEMGYDCEVIHASIRGFCSYKFLLGILGEHILPEKLKSIFARKIPAFRIYKSLAHDMEQLNVSKLLQNRKSVSAKYDCIVVGSDELWSIEDTNMKYIPAYFGVGINTPIFSYATSGIALGDPSGKQLKEILRGLSNFLCISVRDDATYTSINRFRKLQPQIPICQKCIDPTLLNPCFINQKHDEQNYILVYGEDFEDDQIRKMVQFATEKKLKIIGVSWKHNFFDNFVEPESADEFQSYFANSSYCFTSTFHGTIFSILNQRQFISFPTPKRIDKVSDLLQTLDLSDRLYDESMQLTQLPDIDYLIVENKLSVLRQVGDAYLRQALRLVEGQNDT